MKIKIFEFNPLGVNTYVLSDETGECIVIDAACFYADEKELLINYIHDNDLVIKRLVNTHLHFDHIFGVNAIASQFGLKFECHKADEFLLDNLTEQLQLFGIPTTNGNIKPEILNFLNEGDVIEFGNQILEIMHIPGHSPGSIVFYSKENNIVFSGDVLFRESIGRTDLSRGNFDQLIEGINTKLFILPDETKVYSGHGPSTTIGHEKKNNPFVGLGH